MKKITFHANFKNIDIYLYKQIDKIRKANIKIYDDTKILLSSLK